MCIVLLCTTMRPRTRCRIVVNFYITMYQGIKHIRNRKSLFEHGWNLYLSPSNIYPVKKSMTCLSPRYVQRQPSNKWVYSRPHFSGCCCSSAHVFAGFDIRVIQKLILKECVKPYHPPTKEKEKVVKTPETLEPFRLSLSRSRSKHAALSQNALGPPQKGSK